LCKTFNTLPLQARQYVNFIEKSLGVPITYISVGNDRIRTIKRS
jgi:adenylosuccinate synthase